jgi:hypothetical protein
VGQEQGKVRRKRERFEAVTAAGMNITVFCNTIHFCEFFNSAISMGFIQCLLTGQLMFLLICELSSS